ncbi:hypothetical protein [Streptomyces sp. S186]|uniref:hypothetical protein n=1 Tax=Streptomyces sp. S186 TaxID=3434395 RepID=UPI003F67B441
MHTALQLGLNGFGVLGRRPETDLPGVLDLAERSGFDGVEVMSNLASSEEHRTALTGHGIRVAALHLFVEEIDEGGLGHWAEVLEKLGRPALALSCAAVDGTYDKHAEMVRKIERIADRLYPWGTELYFHSHGAEFGVRTDEGEEGIDHLLRTVPQLRLILDTYWIHGPARALPRSSTGTPRAAATTT